MDEIELVPDKEVERARHPKEQWNQMKFMRGGRATQYVAVRQRRPDIAIPRHRLLPSASSDVDVEVGFTVNSAGLIPRAGLSAVVAQVRFAASSHVFILSPLISFLDFHCRHPSSKTYLSSREPIHLPPDDDQPSESSCRNEVVHGIVTSGRKRRRVRRLGALFVPSSCTQAAASTAITR